MMQLWPALSWLLNQLLPPACPLCNKTFPLHWSDPFCQHCLAGFKPLPAAHCSCCALPFSSPEGSSHLCGRCSKRQPAYSKVYCAGLYQQQLRDAIHGFKFNQRVNLDRPLAQLLDRALPQPLEVDLIVPLPLHRDRLRQRSYNQSLLLARQLSRLRQFPLAEDVLLKQQATPHQHDLSAAERESNLKRSFAAGREVSGCRVLLVDDVMTTGTTVARASQVLLQAGAVEVQVAVLARAPREQMS